MSDQAAAAEGDRPTRHRSGRTAPARRLLGALSMRSPSLVDWSVAAGLAGLAEVQLGLFNDWRARGMALMGVGLCLTLLQALPLGLRRRHSVEVLLLTCCAGLVQLQLGIPSSDFGTFGVLVAFYTVVAEGSREVAISVAIMAAVGIFVANFFDHFTSVRPDGIFLIYAQFAAAWVLGGNARHRRRRIADLKDRAERVERENEHRARQAVAAERARIGRELHDVISHSLGVVLVQAGAARGVVDTAPDSARACLGSIETVGREALTEVRRMLDLVRDGDEPGLDSRPGLRSLSDLVDHFRAAGLTVDLEVTGEPRPLPATADLCAYRVLQEALTNTLKHAGRVRARVSIRYYANGVDLEVHDGGPAPGSAPGAGPGAGPGHGLTGMRERVELLGGELSTGPHGRGFSVRARLPLGTGPP